MRRLSYIFILLLSFCQHSFASQGAGATSDFEFGDDVDPKDRPFLTRLAAQIPGLAKVDCEDDQIVFIMGSGKEWTGLTFNMLREAAGHKPEGPTDFIDLEVTSLESFIVAMGCKPSNFDVVNMGTDCVSVTPSAMTFRMENHTEIGLFTGFIKDLRERSRLFAWLDANVKDFITECVKARGKVDEIQISLDVVHDYLKSGIVLESVTDEEADAGSAAIAADAESASSHDVARLDRIALLRHIVAANESSVIIQDGHYAVVHDGARARDSDVFVRIYLDDSGSMDSPCSILRGKSRMLDACQALPKLHRAILAHVRERDDIKKATVQHFTIGDAVRPRSIHTYPKDTPPYRFLYDANGDHTNLLPVADNLEAASGQFTLTILISDGAHNHGGDIPGTIQRIKRLREETTYSVFLSCFVGVSGDEGDFVRMMTETFATETKRVRSVSDWVDWLKPQLGTLLTPTVDVLIRMLEGQDAQLYRIPQEPGIHGTGAAAAGGNMPHNVTVGGRLAFSSLAEATAAATSAQARAEELERQLVALQAQLDAARAAAGLPSDK